ncbi:MAG: sulfite exporter TauE/SafE family protein [Clostridia bacterium]|nr:sulfite exporter TauE/SafE family protein [Clostridia bacterium]
MQNIVISLLIATLMGMGIGGGGFLVIYLTLCLEYGQLVAQGTNLVFFLFCGVSAIFVHLFKRKIFLGQVALMSALGSLGAYLLSRLANNIDPKIPRIALGVLLIVSGAIGIIKIIKTKKN